MKYRKKPVVVEAFHFSHDIAEGREIPKFPEWWNKAVEDETIFQRGGVNYIKTLEGTHNLRADDYVIRGIQGELYPCKSDIFELIYEKVEQ